MKTTIELPDDLLVSAKQKAAEWRVPLRALIEDGLRARLQAPATRRRRSRPVRWITVNGGVPGALDVADRAAMHEWLRTHS